MTKYQKFSQNEWKDLQYAVLDVFMLIAQIDGESEIDDKEGDAFMNILKHPEISKNALLGELLNSLSTDFESILSSYSTQYKFDPSYFESSFTKIGALIDLKLDRETAQHFKQELALTFGGAIANASGNGLPGLGKVEENELLALSAIAKWLNTELPK
jgi:tellurite resistance protein